MASQFVHRAGRCIVRPYLVWKDDLELARTVNDRLASEAPLQPPGPSRA